MDMELLSVEMNGKPKSLAIEVRNGKLSYGMGNKSQLVLNDIRLTVPRGCIYGLLGPSGSGKTSLLNVVVGCRKLNSGWVKVFGEEPGTKFSTVPGSGVGFMPQEVALYPEFTTKETLAYFGRVQHMDQKAIKEQTDVLTDIFNLPRNSIPIEKLSGGQQRRVSLAVALIHKPMLVILDEPTVGVDPLLRQTIWKHLLGLIKEGLTIVLTTHYIEEAAESDYVGLMRNGQMITEESPLSLTSRLGESQLEKCFLKLCSGIDGEAETIHSPETPLLKNEPEKRPNLFATEFYCSRVEEPTEAMSSNNMAQSTFGSAACFKFLGNVLTLFFKNLKRLRRNMILVAFHLITPVIAIVATGICIGHLPNQLIMAVVNQESPADLSAKFLDEIDSHLIIQKHYPNITAAKNAVRDGYVWGVIHLGPEFGASLIKRLEQCMYTSNETIRKGSVNVHLDMTNQQVGYLIQKIVNDAFQRIASETMKNLGGAINIAENPVKFDETIYGDSEIRYKEFVVPGVNINLIYFLAMVLTVLNLVEERKIGLENRNFVNGVTTVENLTAQLLSQSIILSGQITLILLFSYIVFQIPIEGPLFLVIVLMVIQGVYGMSFGLFIASIIHNENLALVASVGSFYPTLVITGLIWPVEGQPTMFKYLSKSLPQTMPTEAMRAIVSRGWGIEHTVVWSSILIVLGWLVVILIATVFAFRFKK